jgi:predicted GH43/DUF377 family glycosyl hydrolase
VGNGVVRNSANLQQTANGSLTSVVDPTAFQKFASNPRLRPTASTWYSSYVEHPNLLKVGAEYWLYFGGGSGAGTESIGRATSTDGVNWTVLGTPVLNVTAGQWDSTAVVEPLVIVDPLGGGYLMYYGSRNGTFGSAAIGLATSPDGVTWTKYWGNPVLRGSAPGGWDAYVTDVAAGVEYDNGNWTMWYMGSQYSSPPFRKAFGVATSTDGRNWTKYASNPVMTPTSSYDSADNGIGHTVRFNGTLHFYWSCNGGSFFQICLATSTTGYAWTKIGVVIPRTNPGWDREANSPSPLVENGTIMMYYGGVDTSSQIGRADALYRPGQATGRLDFGSYGPLSWQDVAVDAALTSGSSVQISVRSSADASAWSVWENVTSSWLISTTPSLRYLEYVAYINATPARPAPTFNGLAIGYTTYFSNGRFESRTLSFAEQISGAALAVTPAPSGGTLRMELSNDNGSTWIQVFNGTFTNLQLAGTGLLYALSFEGTTKTAPMVDWVNLTVERRGVPENVTVRTGAGATPFFTQSGVFDVGLNVSLPVSTLNAIIAQTRIQFPSATSVDVPLVVNSSHYGAVLLRSPRISYVLKNPLSATFSPLGTSLSVPENQSLNFSVAATTFPSFVKINTTWSLNGILIPGQTDVASYVFATNYSSAGNYTLRCVVENGDFTLSHDWNITVLNVNRLPFFTYFNPASPVNVSHTATMTFTVSASDLDGELLGYEWKLDGFAYPGTSTAVDLSNLAVGVHTLNVDAIDAEGRVGLTWYINSTNALPILLGQDPSGGFSLSHTATRTVSVQVTDADGDLLEFSWTLDGAAQGATGPVYAASNLPVGPHAVVVTVRDPYSYFTVSWIVISTNDAPFVSAAFPLGDGSVSHTGAVDFLAVFTDPDGDALGITWIVDGNTTATGTTSFRLDPVGLGIHGVTVRATDGYSLVSFRWNITGTNAAPAVMQALPSETVNISIVDVQQFDLVAADADGDALTYQWSIGIVPLPSSGSSVIVGPIVAGNHELRVVISDGLEQTIFVFRVQVSDFAPQIIEARPATNFTLSHTATAAVSVFAIDHEAGLLRYEWLVDSVKLGSKSNSTTIGPLPTGTHFVRVIVYDAQSTDERTWTVTVTDNGPVFLDVSPAPGELTVNALENITISARGIDPDGDLIALLWGVDGTPHNVSGPLTLSWDRAGRHLVTLDGASSGFVVTLKWNVSVVQVNNAPVIRSAAPTGTDVRATTGNSTVFAVEVDDDGVLPLKVEWFLDGVKVGEGTGFVYSPTSSEVGTHTLEARVGDGEFSATNSWNVLVSEPALTTQTSDLGPLGIALLLVAAAAGAVVAGFFIGRRRKQA